MFVYRFFGIQQPGYYLGLHGNFGSQS
jgi:hypothetical protein